MLTTNSDQIIVYLKGGCGSIDNIEGPLEVLQKFIIEQVINTIIFKLSLYYFNFKKPKYAATILLAYKILSITLDVFS